MVQWIDGSMDRWIDGPNLQSINAVLDAAFDAVFDAAFNENKQKISKCQLQKKKKIGVD
jgi:hypothetical protein